MLCIIFPVLLRVLRAELRLEVIVHIQRLCSCTHTICPFGTANGVDWSDQNLPMQTKRVDIRQIEVIELRAIHQYGELSVVLFGQKIQRLQLRGRALSPLGTAFTSN